jgi:preprotein translocase subunit SecE
MEEGEVAESKRRGGDDAVDERLDEAFDDAVDDDTQDDYADDVDEESERPVARRSRSTAATRDRVSAPKKAATDKSVKTAKGTVDESLGLFGRIARFIREVVAELRKVNWPSRNELITYTLVVVIFVVVMVSIVAGLDYGFASAVGKVFGK